MTTDSQLPIDAVLTQALQTPEDGVQEPTSRRPWSFTSQVANLEPGQVACRLHPVDPASTLEQVSETITQLRAQCRNNASPSVRKAAARTGGVYTTEVCDLLTPKGQLYIATIVTRIT